MDNWVVTKCEVLYTNLQYEPSHRHLSQRIVRIEHALLANLRQHLVRTERRHGLLAGACGAHLLALALEDALDLLAALGQLDGVLVRALLVQRPIAERHVGQLFGVRRAGRPVGGRPNVGQPLGAEQSQLAVGQNGGQTCTG